MATSNTLKLAAIAALLAILASTLTANAYSHGARDEFDGDENPSERCQREVRQCRMQPCKNFMKSTGGGRETFGRGVLAMPTAGNQMSMKEKCCRELREVSEGCRCEAVREMMREMMEEEREGGGFGGGGGCRGTMEEMMRKAERLPSMCGMRPEYCCVRGGGW